jgi:hypothetical protein
LSVRPRDARAAFLELSKDAQRLVHLELAGRALVAWEAYCAANPGFEYVDSVVGMRHGLDAELPRQALAAARAGQRSGAVDRRYLEPLAALQDDDLQLPEPVEFAFYAVYNCYRKYVDRDAVDEWLIVNQAVSALPEAEWTRALERAIAAAAADPAGSA